MYHLMKVYLAELQIIMTSLGCCNIKIYNDACNCQLIFFVEINFNFAQSSYVKFMFSEERLHMTAQLQMI